MAEGMIEGNMAGSKMLKGSKRPFFACLLDLTCLGPSSLCLTMELIQKKNLLFQKLPI